MQTKNLPLIGEDTSLKDAIVIMSEGRLGNILVEKQGKLIGVLSDGDLRRAMLRSDFSLENKAFEYATKEPKYIDNEEMLASDAIKMIEENKMQLLVITDSEKNIKGVVHLHTLVEMGIK
jgi:arabinose-5-phosphate isomerase